MSIEDIIKEAYIPPLMRDHVQLVGCSILGKRMKKYDIVAKVDADTASTLQSDTGSRVVTRPYSLCFKRCWPIGSV